MRQILATLGFMLAVQVAIAANVHADHITASGPFGSFDDDGNWVELIFVTNTGPAAAVNYIVTSQPYNGDKWQHGIGKDGTPVPGKNVSVLQQQVITIPAGQTVPVQFRFTGAEAKQWENMYPDVYSMQPLHPDNRHFGDIGPYPNFPLLLEPPSEE